MVIVRREFRGKPILTRSSTCRLAFRRSWLVSPWSSSMAAAASSAAGWPTTGSKAIYALPGMVLATMLRLASRSWPAK